MSWRIETRLDIYQPVKASFVGEAEEKLNSVVVIPASYMRDVDICFLLGEGGGESTELPH